MSMRRFVSPAVACDRAYLDLTPHSEGMPVNQPIDPQPYQKVLNGGVSLLRALFYMVAILFVIGLVVNAVYPGH